MVLSVKKDLLNAAVVPIYNRQLSLDIIDFTSIVLIKISPGPSAPDTDHAPDGNVIAIMSSTPGVPVDNPTRSDLLDAEIAFTDPREFAMPRGRS